MIIEEHRVVTLAYELRKGSAEGELLERMDVHYPFKFFYGSGKLLPAFEQHLYGLSEGQSFRFTLSPEQAYGLATPANILNLPIAQFRNGGDNLLVVGNYVTVTDEMGHQQNGRILSWDESKVRVDFNHAMAGLRLHFSGVVLNVREATVDELIRKQFLGEDGVHRPGWENDRY